MTELNQSSSTDSLNMDQKLSDSVADQFLLPVIFLVLSAVCVVTIDDPVSSYFSENKLRGEIEDFVNTTEHFGTPYGQFLILAGLYFASTPTDRRVFRIFTGTCAAGLAANAVKLCIGRMRPRSFDFANDHILESFTKLFPFHSGGSAMESFPSAHTASAFGFAALLTWAYPKGKSLFLILAFMVASHRISKAAHFPSDVFAGAALGWSVGIWFTRNNWITQKFGTLEHFRVLRAREDHAS